MSDTEENESVESEEQEEEDSLEEHETLYLCKKCPGKKFTINQIEKHKQWHKKQKEKRKQGDENDSPTGRKSKRQRRSSPAPSSLFFEKIPGPKSPKNKLSADARKKSAKTKYKTQLKTQNTKKKHPGS